MSDLPGIDDIAGTGQGILSVSQKNSQAIADKVLQIFYNPDKIMQYSKIALASITEKQSWEVIGKQYRELIGSIIQQD
jgi:glycosyltransferase involved in cell wall biosynthesis